VKRKTRVSLGAAALLDSLFEHPDIISTPVPYGTFIRHFVFNPSFSAAG
jgi:hypothetical protein